ncbi:hypothetical protein ACWBC2_06155 [Salegentibacter agarivorans]|jgi:hypothetical protein|uniref:Uncharacterized protein n=1 Tax=Christiangramia sediminicola TaxID=3073267 RepID=A0ABU1EKW6_9FLAO|nr:hypothetical protein [Christiangramia sp. SM2212]MDR5589011.1 hypothetical protein [Christiangramia sp. SM2212]|tara:strand:- start:695 stop:1084 length:390 start_codon:yes stop_codon:yes gene_type:complete
MEILVLLAVVLIIGALLGGKSFGGTVRKGCGFLIILLVLGIIVIGIFYYSKTDTEDQESIPTLENSPNYIATENCATYSKPDIESTSEGSLETGNNYLVEDSSKFKYFYEITFKNGEKLFVRQECLERK